MNAKQRYDSLFQFYAEQSAIDWNLLKAQAIAESALDPDAISKVGAKGLAQFVGKTWEEWKDGSPGIQPPKDIDLVLLDPRDPEDAIRAQAAYMAWLLKMYNGDRRLALSAYNWGIGKLNRLIEKKHSSDFSKLLPSLPSETRTYVKRIEKLLESL
jgi:membrane-bound lytic murein transglycosylase D